jgi:hypothetical protein
MVGKPEICTRYQGPEKEIEDHERGRTGFSE